MAFRSTPKMLELPAGYKVPLDVAQFCFVPPFVLLRNQGRMKAVGAGTLHAVQLNFLRKNHGKPKTE